MKLFLILALNFLCFSLFASADVTHYKIGTYNVENLWDADAQNTPDAWQSYLSTLPEGERAAINRVPRVLYLQCGRLQLL